MLGWSSSAADITRYNVILAAGGRRVSFVWYHTSGKYNKTIIVSGIQASGRGSAGRSATDGRKKKVAGARTLVWRLGEIGTFQR